MYPALQSLSMPSTAVSPSASTSMPAGTASLPYAGVQLCQQPTPADDRDTLREITQRIGDPVMADESVCAHADALAVVKKHAADVVAIKPTKLGGLIESKKPAAIAETAGRACH